MPPGRTTLHGSLQLKRPGKEHVVLEVYMLVHRLLHVLELAVERPEGATGPFRHNVRIGQLADFGEQPAGTVVLTLHRINRPSDRQPGGATNLDLADCREERELFGVHVRDQLFRQLLDDLFDSPEMYRPRPVYLKDLRGDRLELRQLPPERIVVRANDVIDERLQRLLRPVALAGRRYGCRRLYCRNHIGERESLFLADQADRLLAAATEVHAALLEDMDTGRD